MMAASTVQSVPISESKLLLKWDIYREVEERQYESLLGVMMYASACQLLVSLPTACQLANKAFQSTLLRLVV